MTLTASTRKRPSNRGRTVHADRLWAFRFFGNRMADHTVRLRENLDGLKAGGSSGSAPP